MTRRAALALSLAALALGVPRHASPSANQGRGPRPIAVTDVSLDRKGDDARWTLLLRDGRIEAIRPASEPVPPGYWLADAEGALALPAFLDAWTRTGCATPEPAKDQDRPLDERSDVRVDMREANRKGIQPAFRAADVLALEAQAVEDWLETGFGLANVAPGGELLAGSGVLAAVRDAAPRDLVVRPETFQHGTFDASGPGYPSTFMGYMAQLRQFFLDADHQREALERFEAGRPGQRPPHDPELAAGIALTDGTARLACHAQDLQAIERWTRLARELGLRLVVTGGGEAWRAAGELAAAGVPVILDLDWSEEVEDPFAEEEAQEASEPEPDASEPEPAAEAEPEAAPGAAPEAQVPGEPPSEATEPPDAPAAPEGSGEEPASAAAQEPPAAADPVEWTYTEPLAVRVERRRLWEEERDNALRLAEAGVAFAFGTGEAKPKALLKKVRQLVEAGLAEEAALGALTTGAAAILGVEGRLGRLEPGYDATLCLWSADPLTDGKAEVRRAFVDGYERVFEAEEELEGEPAEGVDPSGTWRVFSESEGRTIEAELELEMDEDGALSGTFSMPNPYGEGRWSGAVEGKVAGRALRFEVLLATDELELPLSFDGELVEDEIEGRVTVRPPGGEPDTETFRAERKDPESRSER